MKWVNEFIVTESKWFRRIIGEAIRDDESVWTRMSLRGEDNVLMTAESCGGAVHKCICGGLRAVVEDSRQQIDDQTLARSQKEKKWHDPRE